MARPLGSRPKVETPKVHVGFRLSAEIVEGIKATDIGYNARVEMVLRARSGQGPAQCAARSAETGMPSQSFGLVPFLAAAAGAAGAG